jgi:hypothetical protein
LITIHLLGAGIVGFFLAIWAITLDAQPIVPKDVWWLAVGWSHLVGLQEVWWAAGWLYLFVTAARATYVARFYFAFSKRLSTESDKLYALDLSRSVLVKSISSVSQSILLFWVGISSAILLIGPFIRLAANGVHDTLDWHIFLGSRTAFTLLVVPVVSVFSLPFGTYVFIRSEHAIKSATDTVLNETLVAVER